MIIHYNDINRFLQKRGEWKIRYIKCSLKNKTTKKNEICNTVFMSLKKFIKYMPGG